MTSNPESHDRARVSVGDVAHRNAKAILILDDFASQVTQRLLSDDPPSYWVDGRVDPQAIVDHVVETAESTFGPLPEHLFRMGFPSIQPVS